MNGDRDGDSEVAEQDVASQDEHSSSDEVLVGVSGTNHEATEEHRTNDASCTHLIS